MSRQELIDKLYEWYCEWLENKSIKTSEGYENDFYAHQEQRNLELKKDKMRRLHCMTDEKLREMFVLNLAERN